ncbi:MAG: hypothetical protein H0U59_10200 [Gemmatimonadaceae bacterium]|nr:hypothetical protein [Gemmatimonadaceae bacterium]
MIDAAWIEKNGGGMLLLSLFLGAVLTFIGSHILLARYRKAVQRAMRRQSGAELPAAVYASSRTSKDAPTEGGSESSADLLRRASRGPWEVAGVFALAGTACAVVAAIGKVLQGGAFSITLFAGVFAVTSWIVFILVMLAVGATKRRRRLGLLLYLAFAGVVLTIVLLVSPESSVMELLLLWLLFNLPPTLLVALILSRGVRAAGPIMMVVVFLGLMGSNVLPILALLRPDLLKAFASVGASAGMSSSAMFWSMLGSGFAVAAMIGAMALRRVRKAYEQKRISDLTLAADAVVIPFAVWLILLLGGRVLAEGLWGVGAFIAYKVTAAIGLALVSRRRKKRTENRRLLLLRVFALGGREEDLLRSLSTHWRHVGSIQLIAAPDVAAVTLEPHELMDFVSGRLSLRFIDSAERLQKQLENQDLDRDPDGRFRVNEFFCNDHAWRATFNALARETDAVLMDLRAFGPAQKGCAFEIETLMNALPMDRLLFLADGATDQDYLRRSLQRSMDKADPESPNRNRTAADVSVLTLDEDGVEEIDELLGRLCIAARAHSKLATKSA